MLRCGVPRPGDSRRSREINQSFAYTHNSGGGVGGGWVFAEHSQIESGNLGSAFRKSGSSIGSSTAGSMLVIMPGR
ncbi:MAG: hypothetical protein ACKVHE_28985 [Planctomycetales bacterium]